MNNERYERAYRVMCANCPDEKRCNEECATCDTFDEFLEGGGSDE